MENLEEQFVKIEQLINDLRKSESNNEIADLRIDLAGWKAWVGGKLVESEMAYNRELNQAMESFQLSAAKAEIQVKAGEIYRVYARVRQLYKDIQTVISAARTKLAVLEDEFRNH